MRGERGRAGRWTVGRAVRESGRTGARRRTLRRGTDGRARASKKAARSTRDRQTWDGRTARSADKTWVLADFHQYKGCDTYCTRQVHMVHGSWSMGMRANAHTGPLNCLGMGGTWAHVGNAHRRANWTANVQAGMCTRVAHGVSVTLFLPNCAIRQAGQRRVHGARSSVRLCACDCVGMEIRGTARTVVARAWDSRLLVRRLRAFDCMGMEIRRTARTASRLRGTVDCSSAVCARSTARLSGSPGTTRSCRLCAFDCDCLSALCVRLRLHVVWA